MQDGNALPAIPVYDVGADFPMEIAQRVGECGYELLQKATGCVPLCVVRLLDRISRNWLVRNGSAYLNEIDRLAQKSREPGLYLLNVNYEWGCTSAARPASVGSSAILHRTLDWDVAGIGRSVVAARIANPLGAWAALTWPAFTGIIQAIAPGRFAAAINQPTLARWSGFAQIDRLIAKRHLWNSPDMQAMHLLRRVFETAPDFATARLMLETTPIASATIFTLAGVRADETLVIERRPRAARVFRDAYAANEWRTAEWHSGHHHAFENDPRIASLRRVPRDWDTSFSWMTWPLLNEETRLVMQAEPASGRFMARGYEHGRPATQTLIL